MIKLYDISKAKTNMIGYWKDKNKLYKDYIKIIPCYDKKAFINKKNILFNIKKQLAIFYIKNNIAYIEDKEGNIQSLKNNIILKYSKLNISIFKKLLKKYNGFTVFKNKGYYIIDIWAK